jgi:WD40 repeat protein
LIDERLLTEFEVQESEGEESSERQRVEIIHESLLASWPRLVRWQAQDAEGALLRDQLRQAAQLWEERGRPVDLLWIGISYREFQMWRERYPGGLTATEDRFAGAMVQHAERRRRRRRIAVSSAFVLLATTLVVIGGFWRRAVEESRRAEAQELFALGQLELEGDPTKALAYAIASLERADAPTVRRFALEALWRGPTYFRPNKDWRGDARSAAFSPDDAWLAVGALHTGDIVLWPRDGGAPTRLSGPGEGVAEVAFGPRSDRLISSAPLDDSVSVWSVPDGQLVQTLKVGSLDEYGLRPIYLSSDGERLWSYGCEESGSPCEIREWRLESGLSVSLMAVPGWPLPGPGWVVPAAVDPGGTRLAYFEGSDLYVVSLGDLKGAAPRRVGGHGEAEITAVAFDEDGRRLASGDSSGGIRIWSMDPGSERLLRTVNGRGLVSDLRFNRTGASLAAAPQIGMALLWHLDGPPAADPLELRGFQYLGDQAELFSVVFDTTDRWLATIAHVPGVTLWTLDRPFPRILRGHTGDVFGLAFAPDGSFLLSQGSDGTLRRWGLTGAATDSAQEVLSSEIVPYAWLDTDSEGRYVITMSRDPNNAVLVPLDDSPTRFLTGFKSQLQRVAISPDGRLAAASAGRFDASQAFIRVWDLGSGESRILDTGDGDYPQGLHFTQDGGLISVSGGHVHRWDPQDGTHEIIVEGDDEIEYWGGVVSRNGRRLLTASNGGFHFHDLEAGVSRHLASHGGEGTANYAYALDPSGTIAVTSDASGEGTVRVGRVSGEEPHLLLGHERTVNHLAISPDLRWIASSSADGTIRLWPMPDLDKKPLYTLPYEEFLDRLRSFTNVRVAPDEESPTGYDFEFVDYPGWEASPTW